MAFCGTLSYQSCSTSFSRQQLVLGGAGKINRFRRMNLFIFSCEKFSATLPDWRCYYCMSQGDGDDDDLLESRKLTMVLLVDCWQQAIVGWIGRENGHVLHCTASWVVFGKQHAAMATKTNRWIYPKVAEKGYIERVRKSEFASLALALPSLPPPPLLLLPLVLRRNACNLVGPSTCAKKIIRLLAHRRLEVRLRVNFNEQPRNRLDR